VLALFTKRDNNYLKMIDRRTEMLYAGPAYRAGQRGALPWPLEERASAQDFFTYLYLGYRV
jgi:hypothetical protein